MLSIEEIKELVTWAKAEGLSSLKVGEIQFEISPHYYVDKQMEKAYANAYGQPAPEMEGKSAYSSDPSTFVDEIEEDKKEEEDLLMWSTNA